MPASHLQTSDAWWKSGVLYQIYPRSFADSNGDGIGDLRGVIDYLDHLQALGVDALWLSPIMPSPNADWGYDVADYCDVHPDYGTLDDLDALVTEAGRRGARVLLDLVPNHTSDQHSWFLDARSSRSAEHRDWYVWADPKPDGSAPNNWVSAFGGPAWSLDDESGQYYLHNFLPEQPDLNWWNEDVRDAFDKILRFWFDRGVAGFRIDVCHMIIKDAQLRDNPMVGKHRQKSVYNANRPEVHDVLRRWRKIADSYESPRILVGETNVEELDILVGYYGSDNDELNLAFNFPFIDAPFEVEGLRAVFEKTLALLPAGAWPVWTGSNHDVSHLATRWAKGDPAKIRAALLMLLCLPGTTVLYEGDEIGVQDTTLTREDLRDPVGMRYWPHYAGRDPERSPMPWRKDPGAGFTKPGVKPWLPFGDLAACNVEAQQSDPGSVLALTRDLIALRHQSHDLGIGDYTRLDAPPELWAWRRGETVVVALNLSDSEEVLDDVEGTIAIATDRSRDGEAVSGRVTMRPWQGLVIAR